MSDYKVNFREMKSRVGIDDIAYALGYRLDRKAGVGRYIELVLGEGGNRRDTLIVSHPNDKAVQTFFRRDGSKGDVDNESGLECPACGLVFPVRDNIPIMLQEEAIRKDDWERGQRKKQSR